jgi:hypothetical protein
MTAYLLGCLRCTVCRQVKAMALEVLMELVVGCPLDKASGGMDLCTLWKQMTDGLFALPINLPGTSKCPPPPDPHNPQTHAMTHSSR